MTDFPADDFAISSENIPPLAEEVNGQVHPKNYLNDLTGSQWVYFLNSIWQTCYTRSGNNTHDYDLRKSHPSPKPPELLTEVIQFFTKSGGKVLDPFAGVGSSLLACAMTGREGVGMELNQEYIDVYYEICKRHGPQYKRMPMLQGDARELASNPQVILHSNYNLIIADPPYTNMLARPRTRNSGKEATPFSTNSKDLGNIPADETGVPYATFLSAIKDILAAACDLLVPKGHLIVFCKDLQPTAQHHNLLHADLVVALSELPAMRYKGQRIWANLTPRLYPFGYPSTFVANQIHQYMLVFRREPE